MNRIIIDADFILWKVLPNKKQTEDEIAFYGRSEDRTFDDIKRGLESYIRERIFEPTEASEYIGFIGGRGNFRKDLTDDYKASRKDIEFPKYFNESREYLKDSWGFIPIDGMEAEDAVGIAIEEYPDAIMVREDHDLDQLEGNHYNPTKCEHKNIDVNEAHYNQWLQCLTGCNTDKVKGIPGIGPAKATKILEGIDSGDYHKVILDAYMQYFGEYNGVIQFSLNYQLLKILTEKADFVMPEFTQINNSNQVEKIEF